MIEQQPILIRVRGIVAITLLCVGIGVLGPDLRAESGGAKHGQYWGQIEAIDAKTNNVVIGDRIFHIAPNARVHRLAGDAPFAIGTLVEFNTSPNADSNIAGTITELWIVGNKKK